MPPKQSVKFTFQMWPPRNLGKWNTISGLVLCQFFVQNDWISNPHQIEPQKWLELLVLISRKWIVTDPKLIPIEDFPKWEGWHQPIVWPNFKVNCMKMKKIGPEASKILLCRSATEYILHAIILGCEKLTFRPRDKQELSLNFWRKVEKVLEIL